MEIRSRSVLTDADSWLAAWQRSGMLFWIKRTLDHWQLYTQVAVYRRQAASAGYPPDMPAFSVPIEGTGCRLIVTNPLLGSNLHFDMGPEGHENSMDVALEEVVSETSAGLEQVVCAIEREVLHLGQVFQNLEARTSAEEDQVVQNLEAQGLVDENGNVDVCECCLCLAHIVCACRRGECPNCCSNPVTPEDQREAAVSVDEGAVPLPTQPVPAAGSPSNLEIHGSAH